MKRVYLLAFAAIALITPTSLMAQSEPINSELLPPIKNLHQISEHLLSSGLPEASHFEQLRVANVEAVISVIPPTAAEAQPNLAAIYEAGLIYLSVPFNLSAPITAMEAFMAAVNSLEGKNYIVFCASNNRASIMLYTHHLITTGHKDKSYLRKELNLSEFLESASTIYDNFVAPLEAHYGVEVK